MVRNPNSATVIKIDFVSQYNKLFSQNNELVFQNNEKHLNIKILKEELLKEISCFNVLEIIERLLSVIVNSSMDTVMSLQCIIRHLSRKLLIDLTGLLKL